MHNRVSTFLISLIRKIKENSRVDLVVERLLSRLGRGQLQTRDADFVGNSARLNLALIKLRAVQIINSRNSEFHDPTILNTSNLTKSGHVDGEPSS